MPRRSRPRKQRSQAPQAEKQEVQLLKELVTLNKQQLLYATPSVPDVPQMRLKKRDVKTFQVNWPTQTLTTNTAVALTIAYSYSLSALSNASEFTNLFDEWRLLQVIVSVTSDNGYSSSYPVYTMIDYTDAAPPSIVGDVYQYETLQVNQIGGGQFFQRVFNPRAAINAFSGTFTSYASAPQSQWFQTASPSSGVQYYGMKLFVPPTPAAAFNLTVSTQCIFQFRDNK